MVAPAFGRWPEAQSDLWLGRGLPPRHHQRGFGVSSLITRLLPVHWPTQKYASGTRARSPGSLTRTNGTGAWNMEQPRQ